MQITSRHHLRRDAVDDLITHLTDRFGITLEGDSYELVEFADSDIQIVLVDGEPLVAYLTGDDPIPTVEGANIYPPSKRVVTVDAGAIPFVSDGADVMRPGIVEADDAINPDDIVIIAEETHGKILAIGQSRVAASELIGDSGKVIDTLHHVGDELYQFSV